MGRRRLYDYDKIKKEFEAGISERDITTKYKIPRTTLINAARSQEWDKSKRQQRCTARKHRVKKESSIIAGKKPDELKEWLSRVEKAKKIYSDVTEWTHQALKAIAKKIKQLEGSSKREDIDLLNRCITTFASTTQKLTINFDGERRVFSEEVSMAMHQLEEKERQELAIKETETTILKDFRENRTA